MNNWEIELENSSFFDAPILHIDHSLLSKEIEIYKNLIFSPNNLEQIYFVDNCDLKTILLIKNLLTISDYVDNSKIEKYVLVKLKDNEIDSLINMSYEAPENWNLPYLTKDEDFFLTNMPNLRLVSSFIDEFKDSELSPLEIVMKVYDNIKLFNYDEKFKSNIPEIIKNRCTDSMGFNQLFSYTLDRLGFKTYLGDVTTDTNSLITLVSICDNKYGVDGIYLFNPSDDNLPKEKYKKDIRRINYNFFGLNFFFLNNLNYNFKYKKILGILSLDNYDYAKEKEEICKDADILKEEDKIIKIFNLSFEDLYKKLKNSKNLDIDTIIKINDILYSGKDEKYNEYLEYNYNNRKDELFKKNKEEELKDYINYEKN